MVRESALRAGGRGFIPETLNMATDHTFIWLSSYDKYFLHVVYLFPTGMSLEGTVGLPTVVFAR